MGRQEQKPLHQCQVSTQWPCGEIEDLHRASRPAPPLHAPPETPPSRRYTGRAVRRQPAQCRASSASARSAASATSATSETSSPISGANCSSRLGGEQEEALQARIFSAC